MEIYKILAQIMEERQLKIADVARMCNLSDSTVRGIETRKQKNIALDIAFKLSEGLGVSLEYLNGIPEKVNIQNINESKNSKDDISNTEYDHILKYRSLDIAGQKHIDYELEREAKRVEECKKQSTYIKHLETAEHSDNKISNVDMRLINYYYRVASAGTGQIIFDMPPTKRIEIPNTPEYRKVDYAIGVNGTSMEPLYHDGDMLLIEMREEIEIGEIGIFRINGDSFVKKRGETELISLNPDAKNVPLNESAGCMGKVIGKLPND